MPEQNPRRKGAPLRLIAVAIFILALGFGGYYFWKSQSNPFGRVQEPTPAPIVEQEPQVPVDTTIGFASSTMRVSVRYPGEFTLNDVYAYTGVSRAKPIAGVKFTIPAAMATGTNLSADTYIAIEQLPRAGVCTGDIYLAANVKALSVTEGTTRYSIASSTEGAAGNVYEEIVYALASSTPCTAVRYFIHSTNLANYATGTVQAFDRQSLFAAFDKIRQSLVMQ